MQKLDTNRTQIENTLRKMAKAQPYGAPKFQDEIQVKFWLNALQKYTNGELARALLVLCEKRFPLIVELKNYIDCGVDDSQAAADKILRAIGRRGYCNQVEARQDLGPTLWLVVKNMGGWSSLCEMQNSDLGAFRAQVRESTKGVLMSQESVAHAIQEFEAIEASKKPTATPQITGETSTGKLTAPGALMKALKIIQDGDTE